MDTTNVKTTKVLAEVEVPDGLVEALMATFLDCVGRGYWVESAKSPDDNLRPSEALEAGKPIAIAEWDESETKVEKVHTLTKEAFLRGVLQWHINDLQGNYDYDWTDVDLMIQTALFADIKYG